MSICHVEIPGHFLQAVPHGILPSDKNRLSQLMGEF
jgi:hypothetical protein